MLRATHGTLHRGRDEHAADAPRRGDHGRRGRRARRGDDPVGRPPRSAVQGVPEPPRGRVPVDPRRPDPRPRRARGRAQRPDARAAGLHRRGDRAPHGDRVAGGAVDRARQALRERAAPGRGARGARADLGGGVGVALPRGVARGDRRHDGATRCGRRVRRWCSRTDGWRGPRVAQARTRSACRSAGGGARSASSSSTATRRSPTTTGSCSTRSRTRRPSRSSTAGWRCAASSPRRSTIGSRTTCRPSPRCCACRPARRASTRAKALGDSVNRILAIAAVHEVLTEHREDVVELAELVDRLRAMLVQGLVAEKEVTPSSHRSSSPASGRPRSRSSSASCSRTRSSTVGSTSDLAYAATSFDGRRRCVLAGSATTARALQELRLARRNRASPIVRCARAATSSAGRSTLSGDCTACVGGARARAR